MVRSSNLEGKKFGKWIVVKFSHIDKHKNACWLCKCECGAEKTIPFSKLNRGLSKSCGCANKINLEGKKFGKLTVIRYHYTNKRKLLCWLCQCDCGNEIILSSNVLKTGRTRSCGCLKKKRPTKYPLYQTWKNMRQRCYNRNNPAYRYYGGRGIEVCKRWREFPNFLKDMGYRPKRRTLDRINNNGNYTPRNCRWATWKQQAAGRRKKGTVR